jgi:hypothetical protein
MNVFEDIRYLVTLNVRRIRRCRLTQRLLLRLTLSVADTILKSDRKQKLTIVPLRQNPDNLTFRERPSPQSRHKTGKKPLFSNRSGSGNLNRLDKRNTGFYAEA